MKKERKNLNRRDFVKISSTVVLGAIGLNSGLPKIFGSALDLPTIEALMKAATSNISQINSFLGKYKLQVENLKNTKVPDGTFEKAECQKVMDISSVIIALVVACIAIIINIFSYSAGSATYAYSLAAIIAAELDKLGVSGLDTARELEQYIIKGGDSNSGISKMTPELKAAFQNYYTIVNNLKDLAVAVSIILPISKDRTQAAKLLEAIRVKNTFAIEESLKSNISGYSVEIGEAKEENGVFISLRIGNFTHCLSTTNQCGGKSSSINK